MAFYSAYHTILADFKSCYDNPVSPIPCLKVWLATAVSISFALAILAYPPHSALYRKLCILALVAPVSYAFKHHLSFTPSWALCDSFARTCYIWYAHMSHELCVLNYTPQCTKDKDDFHNRFYQARKVLFKMTTSQSTAPPSHSLTKCQFLLHHGFKAAHLYLLQVAWYTIFSSPQSLQSSFLSPYIPSALLAPSPTWERFSTTFQWCIINMLLYESHHSLFAFAFIALGIDEPQEWQLRLFQPLSTAWSVRRYWGKHWHGYIYHSFSGHAKVLTRGWLGMARYRLWTRLVENTLVFAASGLAHTLVRWMQDFDNLGDGWLLCGWYVAQMVPIIVETVMADWLWWVRVKREVERRNPKMAFALQRMVGYVWVVMWFLWCIPLYAQQRLEWEERRYWEMYQVQIRN